jgi:hypothetical protein
MFAGVCVLMCLLSAVVDVAWWRSDGAARCDCHVVLCCAMDCWCVVQAGPARHRPERHLVDFKQLKQLSSSHVSAVLCVSLV